MTHGCQPLQKRRSHHPLGLDKNLILADRGKTSRSLVLADGKSFNFRVGQIGGLDKTNVLFPKGRDGTGRVGRDRTGWTAPDAFLVPSLDGTGGQAGRYLVPGAQLVLVPIYVNAAGNVRTLLLYCHHEVQSFEVEACDMRQRKRHQSGVSSYVLPND